MTINASQLVRIEPGILDAGGNALDMVTVVLTTYPLLPYGVVFSAPDGDAVINEFGALSTEAAIGNSYFLGFNNRTAIPDNLLFARYPLNDISPFVLGADISALPLATMQTYSGTMAISVNGVVRTSGAINLASSVSFSSAASAIQTAFSTFDASVTGTVVAAAGSFTGSISGNTLTVTGVSSGTLVAGSVLSGTGGGGVVVGSKILRLLTGTGGIGTYLVDQTQTVSSTTITESHGLMTVSAVGSGALAVGQTLSGTGSAVTAGTTVSQLLTGTGGTGTYAVTPSQAVSSQTINAGQLLVTYDSVSGAFVFTGGTPGTGVIDFPTGTLAANLFLTTATGAQKSQGARATTPAQFMPTVQAVTQDWACFMTAFNPDLSGYANKLLFSQWNNTQDDAFLYVCWDTDITPTVNVPATGSLGYALQQADVSGTSLEWASNISDAVALAAFKCGMVASIDFEATAGRITFAYKSQTGLSITVTDATVAANLISNGYNFYGKYAARNQQYNFYQPGIVSGPFTWCDTYVDQIWLNNGIQLALLDLLANSNSIPYSAPGYAAVEAAPSDVAKAGINNRVIVPGITLSANQRTEINIIAGADIADTVANRGWYFQVNPATAQVRGARTSPPCTFFWSDGGSIQKLDVASLTIQ